MSIGKRIQKIRKNRGLSQQELGELLGVSGSMIGQYENDLRNPKRETIKKIAKALGVPSILLIDPESAFAFLQSDTNSWDSIRSLHEELSERFKSLPRNEQDKIILSELREALGDPENKSEIPTGTLPPADDILEMNCFAVEFHMKKLNAKGQQIAVERVEELTKIPDYQKSPDEEE